MSVLRILLISLLLWPLCGPAMARALTDDGSVTLSGFGTLGFVHNNTDEAEFIRDIGQPKGADEGWSARTDSLLGLQLGVKLDDELDVVVQGISRYHDTGNFRPELSWAFLRYTRTPAVVLRAGRLGWDVYQLSDSRYVGYAYPWVRPPVDQFGSLQLSHIDGADVTFKHPIGSDLIRLKLYAGRSDSTIYLSDDLRADFDVEKVYGGHLDYETGPWRFRLGYTEVDADIHYAGPPADLIRQYLRIDPDPLFNDMLGIDNLKLYSLGLTYDSGPYQWQTMVNRSHTVGDSDVDSGFVSFGYRTGQWLPFAMFSIVDTSTPGGVDQNAFAQRTYSLGARYDVTPGIALKAQVDRIHVDQPGFLWRNQDQDWGDSWATMFSLGLDFVF